MSSENINILIAVDTDYIKANYTNPSKDPNSPTGINHSSQYMIAADPRGIVSGQATADLNFRAAPGDYVSFTATSLYANSDDAAIVYGIKHWKGDNVFNRFDPDLVTRSHAAVPDTNTDNGMPATTTSVSFNSLDAKVSKAGTEYFYVYIAVYTLAEDGETQELYGYFYWDPAVTVS